AIGRAFTYSEVDFVPVIDDPERRILKRAVEKWGVDGQWLGKLVVDRKTGEEFLWTDSAERVNRIQASAVAPLVAELRKALEAYPWYIP
ncbi:MAG: hypothetical protein MK209_05160, partial [Planctomycetes bacterium]|nr:hypothetical protein [Planctomycetota bacterium]